MFKYEMFKEKDTRWVFQDEKQSRKPSTWDDIPTVTQFSHNMIEALRSKPMLVIRHDLMPRPFNSDTLSEHIVRAQEGGYVECILVKVKGPSRRFFYVNTEGYDYPRYMFEIEPDWIEVIWD